MSLWLVRAGAHGEFEKRFLDESRIYLTWGLLKRDLRSFITRQELIAHMFELWPDGFQKRFLNHVSQIWPFANDMKVGDWVVLPSKLNPTIHFGEITGDYQNDESAPTDQNHWRSVKWIKTDIPKSSFNQDLLYSMGAFMTICRITRNDAESRIHSIVEGTVAPKIATSPVVAGAEPLITEPDGEDEIDLAQVAREEIARLLIRKFKGHELARLVGAILRAQGYTVYVTPPGADKGVDLLAAPGGLGFGDPKICVQVKSSESPCDSDTLIKLIGSMDHVKASHGLLVSWGGFKSSIRGEMERNRYFSVRLWGQDELIEAMLTVYDQLEPEIRGEIPLKRIWTIAHSEDSL